MLLNYNFILSEPTVHSVWSGGICHQYIINLTKTFNKKRVFVWDFILGEMNFFQFGVWSMSYNCVRNKSLITVYKYPEIKLIVGVISFRLFWQKWNFILGDKTSCKHFLKWNHMKGSTWTCTYFIKTKIIGFNWMGRFSRTNPKTKFISFRP